MNHSNYNTPTIYTPCSKTQMHLISSRFSLCINWCCTLLVILIIFQNYSSILSAHPEVVDGRPATLVIESFVVDVPQGNTKDETCCFVESFINCNLKSLAQASEQLSETTHSPCVMVQADTVEPHLRRC